MAESKQTENKQRVPEESKVTVAEKETVEPIASVQRKKI